MGTTETFMAYAADFEKTYVDDDWSRLERYFADDAVYRVESELFGCELTGPAAIFAGIKKSLDGFDRTFEKRELALTDGPDVDGDELRAGWSVTYRKGDLPLFVLEGRSMARIEDGRIKLMVDSYEPKVEDDFAEWSRKTGVELDPSYT